ncbi:hypothetical protein V6N12_057965 [Hibiscus sabdariffa]|uniref:Uncharacterized protein n=1 Tax=Hibiscus sabdariffa TaxID=183260 RepID=A0ABR2AEH5_9ROSI
MTMTHLDLTHAVPVISQFMTAPRSVHLAAVFRIIRYVRGTLSRAFFFPSKRAFVNNRRLGASSSKAVEQREYSSSLVRRGGLKAAPLKTSMTPASRTSFISYCFTEVCFALSEARHLIPQKEDLKRAKAFKGRANTETSLSGSSRSSFLALEVPGSIFLVRLDVISTSPCGVKWDVQGDADDGNGAREDIGERDGIAFYGEGDVL